MSAEGSVNFSSMPLQVATVWCLLVITAISVAYVSHLCREQYAELVSLESSANQMQIDYGRYLLEQSAWGSLQRIETSAIEKFSMRSPGSGEIVIVRAP